MKNLSLLFALLAFVCASCHSTAQPAIGKIINGKPELINPTSIQKNWENFIQKHQGFPVKFEEVKIILQDGDYLLQGRSKTVHAIIELRLEQDQLYEERATGSTRTISCAGCTSGCTPLKQNGTWACVTPCRDCKKTETVTEENILTN